MADQVYLRDPTELASYEIELEAQLAFNGVAEIMSDNFGPPIPVPPVHLMDQTERVQYPRAVVPYMGGPILGSHIRMGTGFHSMEKRRKSMAI